MAALYHIYIYMSFFMVHPKCWKFENFIAWFASFSVRWWYAIASNPSILQAFFCIRLGIWSSNSISNISSYHLPSFCPWHFQLLGCSQLPWPSSDFFSQALSPPFPFLLSNVFSDLPHGSFLFDALGVLDFFSPWDILKHGLVSQESWSKLIWLTGSQNYVQLWLWKCRIH